MSQDTLVNGNRYSFTNISVEWSNDDGDGEEFARGVFKSINYEASQDPGIVQGNQIAPVGRTTGYATGSGSFEMLISEFDDFASDITDDGDTPILSVDFNMSVSYSVNDVDVRTDRLMGVRITKKTQSNSQGNDATMVNCDISIMKMYSNGILVYGDPDS